MFKKQFESQNNHNTGCIHFYFDNERVYTNSLWDMQGFSKVLWCYEYNSIIFNKYFDDNI